MKKVIPFILAALLMVLAISCEKEPIPPAPLPTFSVNINKIGNGSATADKLKEIVSGSTVNFKFTPDSGYSLYSVKVNDKSINAIIPFGSEYTYSYFGINSNIKMDVVFVETNLLILSVQEPAWKLKSVDTYRVSDNSYSHRVSLDDKAFTAKRYLSYPSMEVKMFNPDGSDYWHGTWDLKDNLYRQGGETFTVVSIAPSKFVFKAAPVWSEWDNCYVYAVYTYERVVE